MRISHSSEYSVGGGGGMIRETISAPVGREGGGWDAAMTMCPMPMCPRKFVLGRYVPWTTQPLYCLTQWMKRSMDDVFRGRMLTDMMCPDPN